MSEPALPDALLGYLAARDKARRDEIARTLAAMTDRERALFREAAVMGYAQGVRSELRSEMAYPADSVVVDLVVGACLAMPGLYPVLAGVVEAPDA